ncbi:Sec-independent protein translocase subunit TatA [Dyella tabacisoli]|uniref:Sec-independent protein translocase protein TatA n=1 Tax=Dyella tabacisoli TaxID=2282381 RepID=A0A369UJR2_9GAMM|nr:Sec-independent protein translocase subunit TatA [Dyella tabacisoli]RDD80771.1 Sec-independent protein translocase subunit TatA [Dyella tabacisoli]
MSITHLIILLVVVVLIFGTKKLRNIGSDLGGAVRDFKKGLDGGDGDKPKDEQRLQADPTPGASTTQSQAAPSQATPNQHDSSESK